MTNVPSRLRLCTRARSLLSAAWVFVCLVGLSGSAAAQDQATWKKLESDVETTLKSGGSATDADFADLAKRAMAMDRIVHESYDGAFVRQGEGASNAPKWHNYYPRLLAGFCYWKAAQLAETQHPGKVAGYYTDVQSVLVVDFPTHPKWSMYQIPATYALKVDAELSTLALGDLKSETSLQNLVGILLRYAKWSQTNDVKADRGFLSDDTSLDHDQKLLLDELLKTRDVVAARLKKLVGQPKFTLTSPEVLIADSGKGLPEIEGKAAGLLLPARVVVKNAAGKEIGKRLVGANGTFKIPLELKEGDSGQAQVEWQLALPEKEGNEVFDKKAVARLVELTTGTASGAVTGFQYVMGLPPDILMEDKRPISDRTDRLRGAGALVAWDGWSFRIGNARKGDTVVVSRGDVKQTFEIDADSPKGQAHEIHVPETLLAPFGDTTYTVQVQRAGGKAVAEKKIVFNCQTTPTVTGSIRKITGAVSVVEVAVRDFVPVQRLEVDGLVYEKPTPCDTATDPADKRTVYTFLVPAVGLKRVSGGIKATAHNANSASSSTLTLAEGPLANLDRLVESMPAGPAKTVLQKRFKEAEAGDPQNDGTIAELRPAFDTSPDAKRWLQDAFQYFVAEVSGPPLEEAARLKKFADLATAVKQDAFFKTRLDYADRFTRIVIDDKESKGVQSADGVTWVSVQLKELSLLTKPEIKSLRVGDFTFDSASAPQVLARLQQSVDGNKPLSLLVVGGAGAAIPVSVTLSGAGVGELTLPVVPITPQPGNPADSQLPEYQVLAGAADKPETALADVSKSAPWLKEPVLARIRSAADAKVKAVEQAASVEQRLASIDAAMAYLKRLPSALSGEYKQAADGLDGMRSSLTGNLVRLAQNDITLKENSREPREGEKVQVSSKAQTVKLKYNGEDLALDSHAGETWVFKAPRSIAEGQATIRFDWEAGGITGKTSELDVRQPTTVVVTLPESIGNKGIFETDGATYDQDIKVEWKTNTRAKVTWALYRLNENDEPGDAGGKKGVPVLQGETEDNRITIPKGSGLGDYVLQVSSGSGTRQSMSFAVAGRGVALLIGISAYATYSSLEYAGADVADMRRELIRKGYSRRNIIYLEGAKQSQRHYVSYCMGDMSGERIEGGYVGGGDEGDVGYFAIRKALNQFKTLIMRRKAQHVLVMYSGHGETKIVSGDRPEPVLVQADADAFPVKSITSEILYTLNSTDDIRPRSDLGPRLGGKKIPLVLLLDACRADPKHDPKHARTFPPVDYSVADQGKCVLIPFLSCGPDEQSNEGNPDERLQVVDPGNGGKPVRNGFFAYSLLQGLQKQGDLVPKVMDSAAKTLEQLMKEAHEKDPSNTIYSPKQVIHTIGGLPFIDEKDVPAFEKVRLLDP